jgi:hypothetical protein
MGTLTHFAIPERSRARRRLAPDQCLLALRDVLRLVEQYDAKWRRPMMMVSFVTGLSGWAFIVALMQHGPAWQLVLFATVCAVFWGIEGAHWYGRHQLFQVTKLLLDDKAVKGDHDDDQTQDQQEDAARRN